MGHVHFETTSQGKGHHDLDYVTFSEHRIVAELIRNRMKIDETYSEKCFPSDSYSSSGAMIFVEPVLNLYLDLDRLIKKAGLTDKQLAVVKLMMLGWTIQDIADEHGRTQPAVSKTFRIAVDKIVAENNKQYNAFYASFVK